MILILTSQTGSRIGSPGASTTRVPGSPRRPPGMSMTGTGPSSFSGHRGQLAHEVTVAEMLGVSPLVGVDSDGPSFADSLANALQHQQQHHDPGIAALAAEAGVSLPQWRDPVDDPNNAFGMAEMANLLPPIPQVHPNMLGMGGMTGNVAGAGAGAGRRPPAVQVLPPAQVHPSFAPGAAVRAAVDPVAMVPPLGMAGADLEYLSALSDFSDFSDSSFSDYDSQGSAPSSPRASVSSSPTGWLPSGTTASAPSSAPGTPTRQKKAFRSRSNSAEESSLGTRPARTGVTAPASSRKQIDSAYTAADSRWPPEVLSGDVKAFNKWIKQANLTDEDQSELRRARRRHKNRIYAKRSRSKRRHRGHPSGAGDVDDTADSPALSPAAYTP